QINSDLIKKGSARFFMSIAIHICLLFISAGSIRWFNGWFYVGIFTSIFLFFAILFLKLNPELLRERMKFVKKDTKPFDRIFYLIFIPLYFIVLIVSGLDYRYGWSHMPFPIFISGISVYIVTAVLMIWAMSVNTHFEATVRIQTDRNHKVCTAGPYRFVRHPGYTGFILNSSSVSFILGSYMAILPASLIVVLIIIRTLLEDNVLQKELEGYKEYAGKTKYRLLPFVW
ncbi:MAG: isoprenylcysteine carboxylmethyltransferase family protein, partial [Candidatus Eremiobacterota bacterium]